MTLSDRNDNGPQFDPRDLTISVAENTTAGVLIVTLEEHTIDLDLPPNQGPFRYRMVDGLASRFFQISEQTGRVETNRTLTRDHGSDYRVPVIVSDNGFPTKRSSTLTFTVVLKDIKDTDKECQYSSKTIMSFEQQGSYMSYHPMDTYQTVNASLFFSTLNDKALLMFSPVVSGQLSQGYLAMEIIDGRVKVSFRLGGRESGEDLVVLTTSTSVNNGDWYRVEFNKNSQVSKQNWFLSFSLAAVSPVVSIADSPTKPKTVVRIPISFIAFD